MILQAKTPFIFYDFFFFVKLALILFRELKKSFAHYTKQIITWLG